MALGPDPRTPGPVCGKPIWKSIHGDSRRLSVLQHNTGGGPLHPRHRSLRGVRLVFPADEV